MQSTPPLEVGQSVIVTAQPEDASGNLTTITGVPTWSSANTAISTVGSVSADGLTATITAVAPGATTVSAAGNSSAGNFATPFNVIIGGPATSFLYTFGTPS